MNNLALGRRFYLAEADEAGTRAAQRTRSRIAKACGIVNTIPRPASAWEGEDMEERRERVFNAEMRAAGDGPSGDLTRISGYAAVFNSRSEDLGGYVEVLAPGCFTKTLRENSAIACLWNHDTSYVLGSRKSGTLNLYEDEHGLYFDCRLTPGVSYAQDFARTIAAGSVQTCSFMFTPIKVEKSTGPDGVNIRTVIEAQLWEVSPTVFPAYTATEVQARSHATAKAYAEIDRARLESMRLFVMTHPII